MEIRGTGIIPYSDMVSRLTDDGELRRDIGIESRDGIPSDPDSLAVLLKKLHIRVLKQERDRRIPIIEVKDGKERNEVLKRLFRICYNYEAAKGAVAPWQAQSCPEGDAAILNSPENKYIFGYSGNRKYFYIMIQPREEKVLSIADRIVSLGCEGGRLREQLEFERMEKKNSCLGVPKARAIRISEIGPKLEKFLPFQPMDVTPLTQMDPEQLQQALKNITCLITFLLPEGKVQLNAPGPCRYNTQITFGEETFLYGINARSSSIGIEVDGLGKYGNRLRQLLEQLEADKSDRIGDLVDWAIVKSNEGNSFTIWFAAVNLSPHFSEFVNSLHFD